MHDMCASYALPYFRKGIFFISTGGARYDLFRGRGSCSHDVRTGVFFEVFQAQHTFFHGVTDEHASCCAVSCCVVLLVVGRLMSGLEGCTSLEELWMGKNKITQIAGIRTLTRLKRLDVQSNRLTAIEGLEGLTTLSELYLAHNAIESAAGLESQVLLCYRVWQFCYRQWYRGRGSILFRCSTGCVFKASNLIC